MDVKHTICSGQKQSIWLKYLVILILSNSSIALNAQTWQWGKSGGSANTAAYPEEFAKSTCVDIYGNVYVTSPGGPDNL